jgi:hypothetical protein
MFKNRKRLWALPCEVGDQSLLKNRIHWEMEMILYFKIWGKYHQRLSTGVKLFAINLHVTFKDAAH